MQECQEELSAAAGLRLDIAASGRAAAALERDLAAARAAAAAAGERAAADGRGWLEARAELEVGLHAHSSHKPEPVVAPERPGAMN
jgi:hypothetical protein